MKFFKNGREYVGIFQSFMFADCKSDEVIIWGSWITSKLVIILYSFLRLRVETCRVCVVSMPCLCVTSFSKRMRKVEIMTFMRDVIDKQNGNNCMCAVAINTEVNFEKNF